MRVESISNINEKPFNITTYTLGDHNENKRAYLRGRYLDRAGLNKGKSYQQVYSKENNDITLYPHSAGRYKVSGRANGSPVIDIKNRKVGETLGKNVDKITVKFYHDKVVISVSANEQRRAVRRAKTNNKAVEIFSGGGCLSVFAEQAGFNMDTVVELEDKFIEVFEKNVNATTICADLHDVDVRDLPTDASHMQFGYPCTKYSVSNVVDAMKKKSDCEKTVEEVTQQTKDANFLALSLLDIIKWVNPRSILIEEVKPFLESLPYQILAYALEKLDYKISVADVTGSFTNRPRVAIVAIADDTPVDLTGLKYQSPRTIETHLKTPICERDFKHINERPRESGAKRKGLGIRSHLPSELKINTITTHWTRHTHLSLQDPNRDDFFDDFTIEEIQSLHGLPETFNPGDVVTTARAVLGQGVCDGFKYVLDRIFNRIKEPANKNSTFSQVIAKKKRNSESYISKKEITFTTPGQLNLAL